MKFGSFVTLSCKYCRYFQSKDNLGSPCHFSKHFVPCVEKLCSDNLVKYPIGITQKYMSKNNGPKPLNLDQFLHPHYTYHGNFTPENLIFNANLQEFGQKISYICNLETNGKISSDEAYQEIRQLWKKVKESKHNLFDLDNKD